MCECLHLLFISKEHLCMVLDSQLVKFFFFSFISPLSTVSISLYLFLACKSFVEKVQYGYKLFVFCDQSLKSDLTFYSHFKNYLTCIDVLPACVSMYYVYVMPVEDRKGQHIL